MNACIHALTGIAIGSSVASRAADGTPFERGRAAAAGFALAVLSHGILDGLKHLYPFRAETDLFLSLLLMGTWGLMVKDRYRWVFAITCFGALLPDLLDHGTDLLNGFLGWELPTHAKWFPWHQLEGSGSLYHGKDALYSRTNHLIVLSFDGAALFFNAQPLLRPWRLPRLSRAGAALLLLAGSLFLSGCQSGPDTPLFTTRTPQAQDLPRGIPASEADPGARAGRVLPKPGLPYPHPGRRHLPGREHPALGGHS